MDRILPRTKTLKAFLWGGFFLSFLASCSEDPIPVASALNEPEFIRGADLSAFPKISRSALNYYDQDSVSGGFLDLLQKAGLNYVRLKLWVHPDGTEASLAEVDSFAQVLQQRGLKVWLTLHLSDTWADPGHQAPPRAWANASFGQIKDSLYLYLEKLSGLIQPEIIQIGNEINPGFLLPFGDRLNAPADYRALLDTAILACRSASPQTEIMIHYAGINQGALDFYNELSDLDFDLIGISYYPWWHGKSMAALKNTLLALGQQHEQGLVVAETAYPWTLDWYDWTHNLIGLESQLVSGYPATAAGQKAFLGALRETVAAVPQGRGFAYWGGELVPWKGPEGKDASVYENLALFNFNLVALPVQDVFNP